jgi:hypothetical protein
VVGLASGEEGDSMWVRDGGGGGGGGGGWLADDGVDPSENCQHKQPGGQLEGLAAGSRSVSGA